ncbi:hypothetical protein LRU_02066 [Ligilactobacillus ruminis SPM0211]|uniref:site-specific DNA-methyltransferase (cytosine-N(4)-specific) n=1 Tax=Ligilactobacillus ruminis SPM0211 TaxID=1040964 RepID=F7R2W3_9LACO|nr:hypothetical protein [Ligilactobacillus ruminis]EGM50384.1 hypothetical protein LRU_02066 [Ligilactobacillus ruminis SPM0211]
MEEKMKKNNLAFLGDSRTMEEIDVNSVDLIITSPPYFNLVDYNHNNQIGLTETYDTYIRSVKGGFKLSFYGGLKMYGLGGLRTDRC